MVHRAAVDARFRRNGRTFFIKASYCLGRASAEHGSLANPEVTLNNSLPARVKMEQASDKRRLNGGAHVLFGIVH